MIVPAVLLGGFVVWLVMFFATASIWILVGEWRQRGQEVKRDPFTDNDMEFVAAMTGILTVVLLVTSLLVLPREWVTRIWVILTVVGIVFGLLSVFIRLITDLDRKQGKP